MGNDAHPLVIARNHVRKIKLAQLIERLKFVDKVVSLFVGKHGKGFCIAHKDVFPEPRAVFWAHVGSFDEGDDLFRKRCRKVSWTVHDPPTSATNFHGGNFVVQSGF